MLLMLIGVAVVAAILDVRAGSFPKDAIAIFAIVLLNAVLGYLQESRAEQALAGLKSLSAPSVRVLREGQQKQEFGAAKGFKRGSNKPHPQSVVFLLVSGCLLVEERALAAYLLDKTR